MTYTREQITEIDNQVFEIASKIIESGEEHRPMVFCFPEPETTARPIVVDVSPFMQNDRAKDVLGALLKKLAAEFELVCLVAEAWAVILDNRMQEAAGLDLATVRPSQHPSRIEVLTVSYTIKDRAPVSVHHRIINEAGKRSLKRGDLTWDAIVEGRFVPSTTPQTRH